MKETTTQNELNKTGMLRLGRTVSNPVHFVAVEAVKSFLIDGQHVEAGTVFETDAATAKLLLDSRKVIVTDNQ